MSIIYCSGGGFLFVCLSELLSGNIRLLLNICRGWTDNGNTRQYGNKTVCVGCTERTLVVSFVILLFVCAV